ncbi:MAG: hypothetical protein K8T10_02805 [Candidatus Eremiobacteraeota bacterium]|nr:hypothetical protein [Candidatus Eremiobacteraeota bacterium]
MKKNYLTLLVLVVIISISITLPAIAGESAKGKKIEGDTLKNERVGVIIKLTDGEWYSKEITRSISEILTLTRPDIEDLMFSISVSPAGIGSKNAKDRHSKLSSYLGDKYRKVKFDKGNVGGKETDVLVYDIIKEEKPVKRVTMHILVLGKNAYMIQCVTKKDNWKKYQDHFKKLCDNISFIKRKVVKRKMKTKKAIKFETNCIITHHDLNIDLYPKTGKFKVEDKIQLKITKDGAEKLQFFMNKIDVDSIKLGEEKIPFSMEHVAGYKYFLNIKLPRKYEKGSRITLHYTGHMTDYLFRPGKKLIAGLEILGQVREKSTFSSNVFYYPEDKERTATGDIFITVPQGYRALTSGELVDVKKQNGRATFHWKSDFTNPRLLSFPFAAARYEKYSKKSKAGTMVEIYTWKKNGKIAKERLDFSCELVDYFSDKFGTLKFGRLAIVNVQPIEGLTGVSLPTMIMLSDNFFKADVSREILKKDKEKFFAGAMIYADEISHQWNAYTVGFPNELAEGISKYTDALVSGYFCGEKTYMEHIHQNARMYMSAVEYNPDAPIISKEVYNTPAYGQIAFDKNSVALHMLRYMLGDKKFFEGWKYVYKKYHGKRASIPELQEAMEKSYGKPLGWFFKQWYYRTGYPVYVVSMKKVEKKNGKYIATVTIKQTQKEKPFKMPLDVTLISGDKEKTFPKVMTKGRKQILTFELDFKPEKVVIDRNGDLLKEVAK